MQQHERHFRKWRITSFVIYENDEGGPIIVRGDLFSDLYIYIEGLVDGRPRTRFHFNATELWITLWQSIAVRGIKIPDNYLQLPPGVLNTLRDRFDIVGNMDLPEDPNVDVIFFVIDEYSPTILTLVGYPRGAYEPVTLIEVQQFDFYDGAIDAALDILDNRCGYSDLYRLGYSYGKEEWHAQITKELKEKGCVSALKLTSSEFYPMYESISVHISTLPSKTDSPN